MNPRELAEKVVADWERHARAETYLPESLHWKAKGWLVDAIEVALVSRETEKPKAKRSAG